MKIFKDESGFTLLEMIIGVLIFSIIATGITTSVMKSTNLAYESKNKLKVISQKRSIEDYIKVDLLKASYDTDISEAIEVISNTEILIKPVDEGVVKYFLDNDDFLKREQNTLISKIDEKIEDFKFTLVVNENLYSLEIVMNGYNSIIPINKKNWSYKLENY